MKVIFEQAAIGNFSFFILVVNCFQLLLAGIILRLTVGMNRNKEKAPSEEDAPEWNWSNVRDMYWCPICGMEINN